jgi:hypothetical protein
LIQSSNFLTLVFEAVTHRDFQGEQSPRFSDKAAYQTPSDLICDAFLLTEVGPSPQVNVPDGRIGCRLMIPELKDNSVSKFSGSVRGGRKRAPNDAGISMGGLFLMREPIIVRQRRPNLTKGGN